MRLAFGNYELDTALFELRRDGKPQAMEPQVFDLLAYLATHRDRIVGRQELLDELWTGKVITDSTLSSRIKAARRAVGDNGRTQQCIATFHRRGYRFVAESRELEQGLAPTNDGPLGESALAGSEDGGAACLFPRQFPLHPDRPSLAVLPFTQ